MGQKVHPLGFRVGITKKHQTQWFARFHKQKYAQTILEDRMLRQTLTELFPQLLNPINAQKRITQSASREDNVVVPRITQIKIKRGLIPYEIGIQIHAENCDLLKSSVENLKMNPDLLCHFQKTRRYLQYLRLQLNDLSGNTITSPSATGKDMRSEEHITTSRNAVLHSTQSEDKHVANERSNSGNGIMDRRRKRLSQQQIRRQRLVLKRLKKRQNIYSNYKKLVSLYLTKQGNKVIQKQMRSGLLPFLPTLRSPYKQIASFKAPRNGPLNNSKDRTKMEGSSFSLLAEREGKTLSRFETTKKVQIKKIGSLSDLNQETLKVKVSKDLIQKAFLDSTKRPPIVENIGITPTGVIVPGVMSNDDLKVSPNINQTTLTPGHLKTTLVQEVNNINDGMLLKEPTSNLFKSRIKKKFVSIFVNRMNKNFLQALKISLKNASEQISFLHSGPDESASSFLDSASISLQTEDSYKINNILGWNKNWDFNSNHLGLSSSRGTGSNTKNVVKRPFNKVVESLTISQLLKLITVLEQKALKKMESLRRDYIAFGTFSKTASFNYYQILIFLKQLKEHVSFVKRKQKLQYTLQKMNSITGVNARGTALLSTGGLYNKYLPTNDAGLGNLAAVDEYIVPSTHSTTLTNFTNKLKNIEKECQKIKLMEYLKNVVKKHRTDNIYLYLTSISEARKELYKIKQFTKSHASFLFGLSIPHTTSTSTSAKQGAREGGATSGVFSIPTEPVLTQIVTDTNKQVNDVNLKTKVTERIHNILEKSALKKDYEKTLQDIFLEQIEKQRKMHTDNAQLIPKISIQFYSVNSNSIKAKASIVADSVIDALEKRKAFRKVVKDAKEELMRTPGIKGVKIQLSGRLNGAEIARSEWVRAGRVPLQTLRANIDYSYKTANTIYGIIGVKVWIFKGYTVLNKFSGLSK